MVGVLKRVLKGVTEKAVRLTDEMLCTLLAEVESIVNGRPLTKLSDDPEDLTPLTPNHLLLLKASDTTLNVGAASDAYRSRFRFVQHLSKEFWSRWMREYLPQLQKRSKWGDVQDDVRVGELVLVNEVGVPRGLWPLAIVKEVFCGRDGHVRSVLLRSKGSELRRAITSVIRLEVGR